MDDEMKGPFLRVVASNDEAPSPMQSALDEIDRYHIEELERLLAEAKAGGIADMAIAVVRPGNLGATHVYATCKSPYTLLGVLSALVSKFTGEITSRTR